MDFIHLRTPDGLNDGSLTSRSVRRMLVADLTYIV